MWGLVQGSLYCQLASGAKEIFAYDLDDVAVRVAQENIELNPGMENIHVAAGDLLKGVEIEADVIVANILADILIHLIDDAYRSGQGRRLPDHEWHYQG